MKHVERISPAVCSLLAHCWGTGGWLQKDPVRVTLSTVEAAERRGLVTVERLESGLIDSCTLTEKGRELYAKYLP